MLKVNNKDTRTTQTCSSVSIVNFEQVNACWIDSQLISGQCSHFVSLDTPDNL